MPCSCFVKAQNGVDVIGHSSNLRARRPLVLVYPFARAPFAAFSCGCNAHLKGKPKRNLYNAWDSFHGGVSEQLGNLAMFSQSNLAVGGKRETGLALLSWSPLLCVWVFCVCLFCVFDLVASCFALLFDFL